MSFRSILAPIDFDETSDEASRTAAALATTFGASLTLLHCVDIPPYAYANFGGSLPPPDMLSGLEAAARRALDLKLATARLSVPSAKAILTTGIPWRQILAGIEASNADLVVMGTHGRQGLPHVLLGSVAEKIVRSSSVPVLTVPPSR